MLFSNSLRTTISPRPRPFKTTNWSPSTCMIQMLHFVFHHSLVPNLLVQQAYGQTPDYLLTHLSHTHVPLFGTVVAPSLALKDLPQYLPRYVFNRFSCSFVSIHLKSFLSLSGRHDFFVPFSCWLSRRLLLYPYIYMLQYLSLLSFLDYII